MGINVVIYANHLIRAAYPAMVSVAKMILESGRGKEADKTLYANKRNSNLDTRRLLMAIDPHELFDLFDNSGVTLYWNP